VNDDARIARLEDGLTESLVQNARLANAVEHLSSSVTKLESTVGMLNDAMNKGRGAAWAVMLLSGLVGGSLAALLAALLPRWLGD
jgi:hypothetical protein